MKYVNTGSNDLVMDFLRFMVDDYPDLAVTVQLSPITAYQSVIVTATLFREVNRGTRSEPVMGVAPPLKAHAQAVACRSIHRVHSRECCELYGSG